MRYLIEFFYYCLLNPYKYVNFILYNLQKFYEIFRARWKFKTLSIFMSFYINIVAVRNMNLYKHIMKYSKLSLLHTHMGI